MTNPQQKAKAEALSATLRTGTGDCGSRAGRTGRNCSTCCAPG
jgi:hypothetical protein